MKQRDGAGAGGGWKGVGAALYAMDHLEWELCQCDTKITLICKRRERGRAEGEIRGLSEGTLLISGYCLERLSK